MTRTDILYYNQPINDKGCGVMTHYRQIIINLAVEDDIPDEQLEEVCDEIEKRVDEEVEKYEFINKVGVRIN